MVNGSCMGGMSCGPFRPRRPVPCAQSVRNGLSGPRVIRRTAPKPSETLGLFIPGRYIRRNLAWHPAAWRLSCGLVILPGFQQESQAMNRYREIAPNEMSPAQKRVHDQIIAGKRGRFGGPFHILIRSPELCEYASKLGEPLP